MKLIVQIIKYFILFAILVSCSLIGRYMSKKYVIRVNELEEMRNALNILAAKIKFTYDPLPEIFEEIAKNVSKTVGQVFYIAKEKMLDQNASIAWEQAVEETQNGLNNEDKYVLKMLSKLLRTNRCRRTN